MRIEDAIVKCCETLPQSSVVATDDEGYWNINVVFINSDEREDETQFDVKPCHFDYVMKKVPELVELWKDFCKENGFKQNSVVEVYFDALR